MADTRTDEHLRTQRSVVREYRRGGYDVLEQPRGDNLPSFLRGFAPDLIVMKDDDCAVVEIKTAESLRGSDEIKELAAPIEGHAGWQRHRRSGGESQGGVSMIDLLPRPLTETRSTVTLRKRDWKALIAFLEDIEDRATIEAVLAHEEKVGKEVARRDYLTGDEMKRILDDESPVKVWREKCGLTQRELAEQAMVSPSYLAEIETGEKPGSPAALRKLSRVLAIPMENLLSHPGW
jgi:DNA-binding XRE family transcriptional regulator